MRARIIFFGTPDFAVPALEKLALKHTLLAVVTQPDRPAGRGLELKASAVKQFALNNSIKCFQPESLKSKEQTEELDRELKNIDALVCVAYGKIIPEKYLNLCKTGIINIHPSLLPRWRGAAPLQWSIFAGDKETGVCLMKLDSGLDTGDIFITKKYEIKSDETLGSLHDRLAKLGAELLLDSIDQIISEKIIAQPQSNQNVSYAEKWEKEDAQINWQEHASITERRIRASNPIPGAHSMLNNQIVKFFEAKDLSAMGYKNSEPGTIVALNRSEIIVSCGNNSHLAIKQMQLAGKKKLNVAEILKGNAFKIGDRFCLQ